MRKIFILLLLCVTFKPCAFSQKQLVLLKGEKVVLRLYPGDEIVLKTRNSNTIKRSYVNNLFDNAVMTHHDTIPFSQIDRIYFAQDRFYNKAGRKLVAGGVLLFLIDQLNTVVVQHQDARIDRGISMVSLSMVVVGLPMALLKKKSQKIGYKYRLMTAKKGSVFYEADPRAFASPYSDN